MIVTAPLWLVCVPELVCLGEAAVPLSVQTVPGVQATLTPAEMPPLETEQLCTTVAVMVRLPRAVPATEGPATPQAAVRKATVLAVRRRSLR